MKIEVTRPEDRPDSRPGSLAQLLVMIQQEGRRVKRGQGPTADSVQPAAGPLRLRLQHRRHGHLRAAESDAGHLLHHLPEVRRIRRYERRLGLLGRTRLPLRDFPRIRATDGGGTLAFRESFGVGARDVRHSGGFGGDEGRSEIASKRFSDGVSNIVTVVVVVREGFLKGLGKCFGVACVGFR